jgi:hypothetical protein
LFALALLFAGCVAPPNRDLQRDEAMQRNQELLQPPVRGPVNDERRAPGDPANPTLSENVRQLSSDIPLERIQADNRLKQAGGKGLLAVAEFVRGNDAAPAQLSEAVRFLSTADFSGIEADQAAIMREALAMALSNADSSVRIPAAMALRVHGPGAQRTVFLTAITDSERRVRWEVVQRFSDNPTELDKAQRSILIDYLDAGARQAFAAADQDQDGSLSRREFTGDEVEFARMDRDRNESISGEEWASPYPEVVRSDVIALLFRLHSKLTPEEKPPGYNPWLPSSDQLDIVTLWRQWSEQLS